MKIEDKTIYVDSRGNITDPTQREKDLIEEVEALRQSLVFQTSLRDEEIAKAYWRGLEQSKSLSLKMAEYELKNPDSMP